MFLPEASQTSHTLQEKKTSLLQVLCLVHERIVQFNKISDGRQRQMCFSAQSFEISQ